MLDLLKRLAVGAYDTRAVTRLLAGRGGLRCMVLMLHRFADRERQPHGHDPQRLRTLLAHFRRNDIELLGLDDAVTCLIQTPERLTRPSVIFTVDDCYVDFQERGVPIFGEFDCPVTGFVVPEAVDGGLWFWWDKVQWAFRNTKVLHPSLRLGAGHFFALGVGMNKAPLIEQMHEWLKQQTPSARDAAVLDLSTLLEVEIPALPPPEYRVMSWTDIRAAEQQGVRFGAHTLTHPVLSRCETSHAETEIRQSIVRLQREVTFPSQIFCYPVGRLQDFSARDMRTVEGAGMLGAVATIPDVMTSAYLGQDPDWRWRIPRHGLDDRPGMTTRLLFS